MLTKRAARVFYLPLQPLFDAFGMEVVLAKVYYSNRSVLNVIFEAYYAARLLALELKFLYRFLCVLDLRSSQQRSSKSTVRLF